MAVAIVKVKRRELLRRVRWAAKQIEAALLKCDDFQMEISCPPVEIQTSSPWKMYAPGNRIFVNLQIQTSPEKARARRTRSA